MVARPDGSTTFAGDALHGVGRFEEAGVGPLPIDDHGLGQIVPVERRRDVGAQRVPVNRPAVEGTLRPPVEVRRADKHENPDHADEQSQFPCHANSMAIPQAPRVYETTEQARRPHPTFVDVRRTSEITMYHVWMLR
jgi:hypothetical protein